MQNNSPAKALFESLKTYKNLEELIEDGETESSILECKAPEGARLSKGLKVKLFKIVSGFSNTSGGVLILGISTTTKAKQNIDLLTQVEPIANIKKFMAMVENTIPTLTTPSVSQCIYKIIKEKSKDTRGVGLIYIPPAKGDPVQELNNGHYWYRPGDKFMPAPHELVKKLFAVTESPDLTVIFRENITETSNNVWTIPIIVINQSNMSAKDVFIRVIIVNHEACKLLKGSNGLTDDSKINPGLKTYSKILPSIVYKGMSTIIGKLTIEMSERKKKVQIETTVFADKMIAKKEKFNLLLNKNTFTATKVREDSLY